jgi:plastocyanin
MNSLDVSISGPTPNLRKLILATLFFATLTLLLLLSGNTAEAATVQVQIALAGDSHFTPKFLTIHPGDTVQWVWADNKDHSVVSGNGNTGKADGVFNSGVHNKPFSYSFTFPNVGSFPYFCGVHRGLNIGGPWPVVNVVAASSRLSNISTRAVVQIDNDVLIGGFIVGGTGTKQLLLRALGPTLTQFGVTGALLDPTLELRNSSGGLITFNDNWGTAANGQSIPVSLRPPNAHESAILATLNSGSYTAIVRGVNNTTGVALVEAYDIDTTATSRLTNISTRSLVQTNSNVMIAGVIVQTSSEKVTVRALGPTLASFGVSNPLANPTLELHDANGSLLASNDNWKTTQQTEITASGYAPPNDLESAIVRTLAPGNYTAIVRGVNSATGVALVEVYAPQ